MERIPFSKPSITQDDIDAVSDVMRSGWLTIGNEVASFEQELAERLGVEYVICVDSCTSALTLAIESYMPFSGKICIPALSFIATANTVVKAGGENNLVFCDVGCDGNINPCKIPKDADIVIPVHYAGQPCNMDDIVFGRTVIEDAAHAFGAMYNNAIVGAASYRDYQTTCCFSFYPTKSMTTGEGGCITTNYKRVADYARSMSLHGLSAGHANRYERSSRNYPVVDQLPGYKMNMTNIAAALGRQQLKRLDSFLARRREIVARYQDELWSTVECLPFADFIGHAWHIFVILVDNRDDVAQKLDSLGIGTGVHYNPPLHLHPWYQRKYGHATGDFPVAERIAKRCLSLPLYPDMTDRQVERVISAVKSVI